MRASELKSVLRQIAQGKISRAAAAQRLGVSERHVNRLMRANGVVRPPKPVLHPTRRERALLAEARRNTRLAAAQAVLEGRETLEQAAVRIHCSPRTMYRWVEKAKNRLKMLKNARKTIKNARKTRQNHTK